MLTLFVGWDGWLQDREYFDHHQSGVLQERLNKDTELLAQTIIQQPKNLISAITRVVTKSWFLYMCSPQLFWLGVSIPVPFCVYGHAPKPLKTGSLTSTQFKIIQTRY